MSNSKPERSDDVERREASTLTNVDIDGESDTAIDCPRCDAAIPIAELTMEGSGTCPGCARAVTLEVTVEDTVRAGGQWRNIPEGTEELYQ